MNTQELDVVSTLANTSIDTLSRDECISMLKALSNVFLSTIPIYQHDVRLRSILDAWEDLIGKAEDSEPDDHVVPRACLCELRNMMERESILFSEVQPHNFSPLAEFNNTITQQPPTFPSMSIPVNSSPSIPSPTITAGPTYHSTSTLPPNLAQKIDKTTSHASPKIPTAPPSTQNSAIRASPSSQPPDQPYSTTLHPQSADPAFLAKYNSTLFTDPSPRPQTLELRRGVEIDMMHYSESRGRVFGPPPNPARAGEWPSTRHLAEREGEDGVEGNEGGDVEMG